MSDTPTFLRKRAIEATKKRDFHLRELCAYQDLLYSYEALETALAQANDGATDERGQEDSVQPQAQESEFRQSCCEEYRDNIPRFSIVPLVGLQAEGQSSEYILLRGESIIYGPSTRELPHARCDAPMAQHGPKSTASTEAAKDRYREAPARRGHATYCPRCGFGSICQFE